MLTFGIDWDDVISPLNDCAIELANEEYHFEPPLTLEDIDSWENTGRASVIKKYYSDPRLYEMQQVSDQAKAFIRTLQTKGIVYIVTAVQPQFMSKRVEQIKTAFPDFPDVLPLSPGIFLRVPGVFRYSPAYLRHFRACFRRFPLLLSCRSVRRRRCHAGLWACLRGCLAAFHASAFRVPHRIPGGRERPLNPFFCNTDSAASSVLISGGISRAFRARAY